MFSFPLPPLLTVPSTCSPAGMQRWSVREMTLPLVLWPLGQDRRAAGTQQRASGQGEQPCPCTPLHCYHPARGSRFGRLLGEGPLGLFWTLQRQDRIIQLFFFPSLPGCILPFLLPSNTIFYSLLYWCPDWYLIFKLFSCFPALLMWPDTKNVFCLFFVSCVCFLLFWKTWSSFSWSTTEHKHLGLESWFSGKAALSPVLPKVWTSIAQIVLAAPYSCSASIHSHCYLSLFQLAGVQSYVLQDRRIF